MKDQTKTDLRLPGMSDEAARAALLGHDLRAAVSDIIGGLRLIDQTGMDAGTRLQLERVRTAGETLARLLEEGLALMQGETGDGVLTRANVQLARFMYDLEMRWSGRAREKGIAFHCSAAADLPKVVTLDRIALDRAMANLLSNAVKFTDTGAVELSAEVTGDGALRFVVADNGPGFSKAALNQLFQFGGRPEGAAKPGQGMGMHISRGMADRMGGQLSVVNRPGGGAEVTLELPPDSWTPAAAEPEIELPDLSRIKVLVADDTPTSQSILANMLGRMGAEFEIAEDGVEALHWLEREAFDVALIDIEMPGLSGLDVIRSLRSMERQVARTPVIAVTAYVLRANREAIYASGADAVLAKPVVDVESLGLAVSAALGRGKAPAARDSSGDRARASLSRFDRARFDHLLEIAGPDASRELLNRLCTDLRTAERGLVAALARGDRARIRAESHVLIALAGAVGAEQLQAEAEAMNLAAHGDEPVSDALGRGVLDAVDWLIATVEAERGRSGDAP